MPFMPRPDVAAFVFDRVLDSEPQSGTEGHGCPQTGREKGWAGLEGMIEDRKLQQTSTIVQTAGDSWSSSRKASRRSSSAEQITHRPQTPAANGWAGAPRPQPTQTPHTGDGSAPPSRSGKRYRSGA